LSTSVYDIPLRSLDGADATLRPYAGQVLLIVNVASACGFTPQYEGLEKLYQAQRERGLVVLGFPANNFGAQEPGTSEEIAEFCSTKFGVKFPMFEKISVLGDERHPLYDELTSAQPAATQKPGSELRAKLEGYGFKLGGPSDVLWNFEKFVIGRNGDVVARFAPDIPPDDPVILETIEAELAKSA